MENTQELLQETENEKAQQIAEEDENLNEIDESHILAPESQKPIV